MIITLVIAKSPANEPVKTFQNQSRLHSAQCSKEHLYFSPRYSSLLHATINFVFQSLQPLSIMANQPFLICYKLLSLNLSYGTDLIQRRNHARVRV